MVERDRMREQLSQDENKLLKDLETIKMLEGVDSRWMSIAKTHIEQGFMAAKRALYEGKRVGD